MATETVPQTATKENNLLLEWMSPARPFMKRTKEFYKTAGALVFLVAVILVFVGEIFLIGVIVSIFFVLYVLSTVPPEQIKHKITSLGIETANHFHRFEELQEFWFDEKYGQPLVVIRTYLGFPTHLQLMLGDVSQAKLKTILSERIPFREKPEKTSLDKASQWLIEKIPLERATRV